jgi:hypothetical protein
MRTLRTLLVAAAAALVPLAASAAISSGTELVGSLDQSIDSKSAVIGQRFTMSGVHSQSNDINGATLYGHVCDVQHASQGRPGKLELCFDRLRTRSGGSYAVEGRVTNAQVNTKSNALKEAGGAVAGMIVGNIIGKKLGTNMGGLIGAGGGYLYAKNSKENVTMPANSLISMEVLRARAQTR